MAVFWAFLGAISAVGLETYFRLFGRFDLWIVIPVELFISYSVYRLMGHSSTFLTAIVLFSMCTLTLRIIATIWVFHVPLVKGNLAALVLLITASIIGKVWK